MIGFVPPVHPVIVAPNHSSGGGGGDVPTAYVLAYLAVALVTWAVTTAALSRRPDYDATDAVVAGGGAALGWPLFLLALPMWWLAATVQRKAGR